jgi:hypothetical protein
MPEPLDAAGRAISAAAQRRVRLSRLKARHRELATGCIPAARCNVTVARELLARTAELPDSKRGLLAVLGEYRKVLYSLTVEPYPAETGRELPRASSAGS